MKLFKRVTAAFCASAVMVFLFQFGFEHGLRIQRSSRTPVIEQLDGGKAAGHSKEAISILDEISKLLNWLRALPPQLRSETIKIHENVLAVLNSGTSRSRRIG